MKAIRKIHSFGETNPNAECYKSYNTRTAICGCWVEKDCVTNNPNKITCKRCLKLDERTSS